MMLTVASAKMCRFLNNREENSEPSGVHSFPHCACSGFPFHRDSSLTSSARPFTLPSAILVEPSQAASSPSSVRCNLWAAPLPWPLSSLH